MLRAGPGHRPGARTMCQMATRHRTHDGSRSRSRTAPGLAAGKGDGAAELVAAAGRQLLAARDPLEAELLAGAVLALPYRDRADPMLADLFVQTLCEVAGQRPGPESAALLRAVAAVARPHQRRIAVAALGRVTAAGHYPPDWAGQIGRAAPGRAWRSYDVFGDTETVAVTFGYGEAEHAVVVQIDRCRPPTPLQLAVVPDVDGVRRALDPGDDPLLRAEPLELADARSRLTVAVGDRPGGRDPDDGYAFAELAEASLFFLPVIRARLRRLPAGELPEPPGYGAADRAAAVTGFLASRQAATAGEEEVARFWAEVFAGYSASVPGDPPDRIGPLKLPHLLLSYVPNTFALTPEQRQGLPAAAGAWTEWAAQQRELPDPARQALADRLPEVLASFDAAYADPDNSRQRGYLADLSATTTDAGRLAEALDRRAMAVPPPGERPQDAPLRSVDPADPAGRRALVEHEFAECDPPEGMSREDFLAAAVRVGEQLWRDHPPELWQRARALADRGVADHDIMHQLIAGSEPS